MSEGSVNSAGHTSFENNKHKVQLCRSFAETGFCPYGDLCMFAHGLQELLLHQPIHKTKKCRNYHSNGYCRFGERCNFRHEKQVKQRKKKNLYKFHKILDSYAELFLQAVINKNDSNRTWYDSSECSSD